MESTDFRTGFHNSPAIAVLLGLGLALSAGPRVQARPNDLPKSEPAGNKQTNESQREIERLRAMLAAEQKRNQELEKQLSEERDRNRSYLRTINALNAKSKDHAEKSADAQAELELARKRAEEQAAQALRALKEAKGELEKLKKKTDAPGEKK